MNRKTENQEAAVIMQTAAFDIANLSRLSPEPKASTRRLDFDETITKLSPFYSRRATETDYEDNPESEPSCDFLAKQYDHLNSARAKRFTQ